MSLIDSIRAGRNAYKSGSGAKAAIETAASHRGVNVSAGKSTYVDERDFKRYQDEYNKYVNKVINSIDFSSVIDVNELFIKSLSSSLSNCS